MFNIAAGEGDAAPPSNPQRPTPLPEQRAGAGKPRPGTPRSGAPVPEHRTVMVAARSEVPPVRLPGNGISLGEHLTLTMGWG